MKDIEYIITGLHLGLILCLSESFYFLITVNKTLNIHSDIVLLILLFNVGGCILAVRVLKIETLSYLIDKYL